MPPSSVTQKKKPEPAAEKLALVSPLWSSCPQPVCSDHTRQVTQSVTKVFSLLIPNSEKHLYSYKRPDASLVLTCKK